MATRTTNANVAFDARGLHDLAHQAVQSRREESGWWSQPLETALVAVADAQHSRGTQRMAMPAYERLVEWLEAGDARPIGEDAAAAALTAAAGSRLRGGDRDVNQRAKGLVSGACQGSELALAPLHVALSAWALDSVAPDRDDAPWDDIRRSLPRFSRTGINGALVLFAESLADRARPPMDARLAEAAPLDRTEECLLLWLLTAALAVEIGHGRGGDDTSKPLLRRRTELLEQLSAELGETHLAPPAFADFNPFGEAEEGIDGSLGLFEAILLDLALSGDRSRQTLITLDEQRRLQGVASARRLRGYAAVAAGASVVLTALGVVILALAGAEPRLTVGVAITILAVSLALSLLFLRSVETRWPLEPLMIGLLLESGVGGFLIWEGISGQVVDDRIAALIGIFLAGAPPLATAGVRRMLKK